MSNSVLDTPIEFLKGVGPERAKMLKSEIGVNTCGDLLRWYPFRYVDRTRFYKAREINAEMQFVQLRGQLTQVQVLGKPRQQRMVAVFRDDSGSVELVWFQGVKWLAGKFKPNTEYIVFGKPSVFNGKLNIAHPEVEEITDENMRRSSAFEPVYPATEKLRVKGLDSKGLLKLQKVLHPQLNGNIPETLPAFMIQQLNLVSREQALKQIHFPDNDHTLKLAENRLKFEEFLVIQLRLLRIRAQRKINYNGNVFEKVGDLFNSFYEKYLPFPLTDAQKRVIREIRRDLGSGKQMNRLLQGDVGSGKTVVALLCMLIANDNGFQACLMAPTEILATQHFHSLRSLLGDMWINIGLLTGSTKTSERKRLHEQLRNGTMHILIGTHALIEDEVQFRQLGFVVIDEQHRFGVEQRSKLWRKSLVPPHVLVMTATPIPRTLAMTLYGDLDTSIIDELPPGRKAIKTIHMHDKDRLRVFGFMEEQIAAGRQIYIVYPLINESEKMDYKDLMDGFESISRRFPPPKFQVSIVHGQMKAADKEMEMQRFVKGDTNIMVATTVIEVGVNVPNASVMIIESAERFGLSQLHQLRGRVGRGAEQSFCILMTGDKQSNDSRLRIKTMCETNDGFKISEVDLKLRGPGDLEGTQQSGLMGLRIADITTDADILAQARVVASNILEKDPKLELPENKLLVELLNKELKDQVNWSRIA